MFKCGICGKEFETVNERATHELECVAKEAEKERAELAKKNNEATKAAYEGVKLAWNNYQGVKADYERKYGGRTNVASWGDFLSFFGN